MSVEEPRLPILSDAVVRLSDEVGRSDIDPNLPEPEILTGELEAVARMIEKAALGEALPDTSDERPSLLAYRFLDLLRAEVLRSWPEPDAPSPSVELLPMMRAFEDVRSHLSPEDSHLIGAPVLDPWARRLLGEMAHTLGSSMGPTVMLTEVLASGQSGDLNELQRNHLRILYRAALTSGAMAVDLLRLGGPFEEREEHGSEEFTIADILTAVEDVLGPVLEEREVERKIGMEDGVSESRPRVGRAFALRRALVSLALASMTHATGGAFRLEARPDGEDVHFSIERRPDEGEEESPKAAGPVFRERLQKRGWHISPPALAVASARHLISSLGGRLEVEEMPGTGIRFAFSVALPLAEER